MADPNINKTQEGGKTTPNQPSANPPAGTTGQTGSSAARQARPQSTSGEPSSARELGAEIRERGGEVMDQARQTVTGAYDRASRGVTETWGQAMGYSRENPAMATLIAFGLGVGVGVFLAGGFHTRSRSRRLVPPVMNALSEIADEFLR
jgi:ElaB/YqjD/DUF883 family membrane-anchored ribosome-binding protein